ncbi:MAG: DNA polymerase III subunit gamma/tau [Cyanobacteriota bacterium]
MTAAYQPLHHKYRPQRLADLVGQEAIATTLANAFRSARIAPAYLFSGPRGTGKTSSARILARSLNCVASEGPTPDPCGRCELCISIASGNALDVIEIDAASNTGVDNIRELIERSRFAPVQARWKVYVVDECHMLSTAAFNALLKTLEEPPPRVVFVLATTDPQRVLPTILSRCQRFDFRRIPLEALKKHLAWIAEREGIAISPEALHLVAQRAQGGLRDAESLLDQLSLLPPPIEAEAVWDLIGAVPEEELLTLAQAMAAADPLGVVETTRQLLERGREPNAVLQGFVAMLRDLLLAGVAPERLELTSVSPALRSQLPPLALEIGKDRLLHWHAALKGGEQQLRHSMQPRLWLEVILLGLLEPRTAWPSGAPSAARESSSGAPRSQPGPTPEPHPPMRPPTPVAPPRESATATTETARTGPTAARAAVGLDEIWQQILAGLQLPSTRMLLSQQARLKRLDERLAVVCVSSTWITMVQSRLPLLEKAMEAALGTPRQITLEASDPKERPAEVLASPPVPGPDVRAPATPSPSPPPERQPEPVAPARSGGQANAVAPAQATTTTQPDQLEQTVVTPQQENQTRDRSPAAQPATRPENHLLEESSTLLADFFNGQVIVMDPQEDP